MAAAATTLNWVSLPRSTCLCLVGAFVKNVECSLVGLQGVDGPGFIAHDLTIQNTAGSVKQQALALRSRSAWSVVYRVSLEAHQDTLYAQDNYQFYHACKISGTVDFIFGDATAVFQSCLLVARIPHPGQQNVITAQGRYQASSASGFVFQLCNITGEPLLREKAVETYLGRPWKPYSRVVFIECFINSVVDRRGYLPWNGSMGLDTLYYGEYNNSGPGSDVKGRVNWPGFHAITVAEAANFTVASSTPSKPAARGRCGVHTWSVTVHMHGDVFLISWFEL
ncbi:probable pectinesterase/pectinesterase inhibitor 32 [Miscanthus floridulus]|uniref:probable pectinesterase/pectinesterase inhibitor 32 n=1 Tax=Miscanthus floridulus TaxID=154761 RepID=UPI0034596080